MDKDQKLSDDQLANSSDRRTFIKTAGAAALGAAAALSPVMSGTASASKSEGQDSSAKPLSGRTMLITGAARGIGKATAIELAKQGANIALLDIADPSAFPQITHYKMSDKTSFEKTYQEVAAICEEHGTKALKIIADVRDAKQMDSAVKKTVKELGMLDGVVANAGIAAFTPHDEDNSALHKDIFAVNVDGVYNTVNASQKALMKSKFRGRIVMLSSIAGRKGIANISSYAASKWAVTGLMKSLAEELGPKNIAVNCVAPTGVRTPMTVNLLRNGDEDPFNTMHPLPVGLIEPEDVAQSIAFLISDAARNISGTTLDVNAGISASITG